MNYEEAISYLESLEKFGSIYDLERIGAMLKLLGNPENKLRIIHIAGTNGKGSVQAMLDSILQAAGYNTACYTSPHLLRWEERYRFNGQEIKPDVMANIVDKVADLNRKHFIDQPLTQFEILTACAFQWMADSSPDFCIVETGLGGRLDATNVVKAFLSVLVSISLEHTEVLGNTLRDIAREKAGIIHDNAVVVTAGQLPEAMAAIEERCSEKHARLYKAGRMFDIDVIGRSLAGQILSVRGEGIADNYRLSLLGDWQADNAGVVLTAVAALRDLSIEIPEKAVEDGLAHAVWPGRFQVIHGDPVKIIDGAHNPDGADVFARSLKKYMADTKCVMILSMYKDKDILKMLDVLLPLAKKVYAVGMSTSRSIQPEALGHMMITRGVSPDIYEYFTDAIIIAEAEARLLGLPLVICGSLQLGADARKYYDA